MDAIPEYQRQDFSTRSLAKTWVLGTVLAIAVYWPSLAPGLLWEDSGEAQVRVLAQAYRDGLELSRAHITYYTPAILLHRFGGIDAARAANVVAMLAGAITIGNFAVLLVLLLERVVARVAGTALLLFSHTMWQTSAVAEDNTCTTMFLTLELLAVALFLKTGRGGWLVLAALSNGLGGSNHNWAMLIWPAYAIFLIRHSGQLPRVPARMAWLAGLVWVAGWTPVAVITLQEYVHTHALLRTVTSLLFGVSESQIVTPFVKFHLLANSIGYLLLNFPTPLIVFAWLGWRSPSKRWPEGLRTLLTVAGVTYAAFTVRLDFQNQYRYFIPFYIVLSVFLGAGMDNWLAGQHSRKAVVAVLALSIAGPLVYWVAPSVARKYGRGWVPMPEHQLPYVDNYDWLMRPWRTGYHGAERYAGEVLAVLPQGAVLLADSGFRRPIDYLQGRDGLRPDIRVPFSTLDRPWQRNMQISERDYPLWVDRNLLFCTCNNISRARPWLLPKYRLEPWGPLYRIRYSGNAFQVEGRSGP
jgi:hypothetical protein